MREELLRSAELAAQGQTEELVVRLLDHVQALPRCDMPF